MSNKLIIVCVGLSESIIEKIDKYRDAKCGLFTREQFIISLIEDFWRPTIERRD